MSTFARRQSQEAYLIPPLMKPDLEFLYGNGSSY